MRFQRAIPILRIFDSEKARGFYLEYLGFTVDFEHRFFEGAPSYMGISRAGIVLHLSEHHGDGTPGSRVVIDMEGLDELHRELHAKDYRFMNPGVELQEWGRRELRVIDPFHNTLIFSELVP